MKFSFHLKNNSKVSLGKKNLNPSTSKASLDQSQVNSLTTIIPQPQIPIRKAFLNNSSTNSPIFASNNLINCMEIYFPRVKRASSIMLSLKKKSFSLQNVHSNSNEKSEKFKAKQIEWENFKKNPRYSYLERDSNVDQIPQEQLLEVFYI